MDVLPVQEIQVGMTFAKLGLPALSVAAMILVVVLFSSYVKIVTVLGIVRAGLGLQGIPSALVSAGLALALSFLVMYPTIRQSTEALDKSLKPKSGVLTDLERAAGVDAFFSQWKKFLQHNAQPDVVKRFADLSVKLDAGRSADAAEAKPTAGDKAADSEKPTSAALAESWQVLAPAFFVSELQSAFATGLKLFLPLLVIDLLVAALLTAVGVDMLNPLLVSFPFKLLLFVAASGWTVITANLVASYGL